MSDDAVTRSSESPDDAHSSLVVAAVGASAGGLEALQALVANLPADAGMAFVIAQHLSGSHRSLMTGLLGRVATMPVSVATDGAVLRANAVYVCPPGTNISIVAGDRLALASGHTSAHPPTPSIDYLFRSVAAVKKQQAICVLLSGTGSDGTAGVQAVKEVDGITFAQDPESANYPQMPLSAINTGRVDFVMPPEAMGAALSSIVLMPEQLGPEFDAPRNLDAYQRILAKLQKKQGVDFLGYKNATLSRRIMRRMVVTQTETLHRYERKLEEDNQELDELFHELLIGVTSFFRDPKAWSSLRVHLEQRIREKSGSQLRCWVAGCSTGEEAYSLAMLVADILGDDLTDHHVQIFATDASARHIAKARTGTYAESLLTELPEGYRERFFVRQGSGELQVSKLLRQMIVFSEHDMTRDPPFLRLDLICCRNVMIYFRSNLQETVLPIFAYALASNALLFLGQAEALGTQASAFDVVDSKAKLYRARFNTYRSVPVPPSRELRPRDSARLHEPGASPPGRRRRSVDLEALVIDELDRMLMPAAILINAREDIVFAHGDENRLLRRKRGLPSNNVFDNIHPDMLADLRSALRTLSPERGVTTTPFRYLSIDSEDVWARLTVARASDAEFANLKLIFCQIERTSDVPFGNAAARGDAGDVVLREQELLISKLREQLALAVEQLENSNAEMQSLNEELQSSNEELQSSNEELETTNEELQSTNEELQTAYTDLSIAFDEKEKEESRNRYLKLDLEHANGLLEEAEILGVCGSWYWEPGAEVFAFSQGMFRLLGLDGAAYSPSFEAYTGFTFRDDQGLFREYLSDVMKGVAREPLQYRIVPVTGRPRYVELRTVVRFKRYGQVDSMVGTIQDIDQKVADIARENAAEKRRAHRSAVADALSGPISGIYLRDLRTGDTVFTNRALSDILGRAGDDLLTMDTESFRARFHPEDVARFDEHQRQMQRATLGETSEISYRFKHTEGHWLSLYALDTVLAVDCEGSASRVLGAVYQLQEYS